MWGQIPVEITTSSSNPKLYLIQSYSNEAFYMRNNSRNSANALNTSNIVTTYSEFYFMNGDEIGGTQYYYIVHKGTGKYVYMNGTTAKYQNAPAANATDEVKNTYRFKIVKNSSRDAYNIIPINQTNSLNKTNGNSDGADVQLSDVDDDKSCWNFIAKGNYTKPSVPFIPYTTINGTKHYYYIQNNKYPTYYLIPGTTYVTTNTKTDANKQNMMWYFKKAPASDNDYYIDYYYIVHVGTGKYLHYRLAGTDASDKAVELADYDSTDDSKFLFIFVRGSLQNETHESQNSPTYCIAPDFLKVRRVENTISLCRSQKGDAQSNAAYSDAGVFKERGNNNFVHWNFEAAKIICANPVFTEENGSITLSCETDGSEIYYTENGDDPTDNGVTPTLYTNQSLSSSSQHLIKAFAKLENDNTDGSNSEVVTLLNMPEITLKEGEDVVGDNTYTYDGNAKTPTPSKVYIGTTETVTGFAIDPTTPYLDNTNAGTATVKVIDNDPTDSWYIWNASTTFTINQKEVGLTWTPNPATFTYNGVGQSPTATATGLIGTDACTVTINISANGISTLTDGNAVCVGSYTATASALSNTNYKLPDGNTQDFSITQKALTITADNDTKVYDGTALTKNSYTNTNLATGDNIEGVTITGSQLVVGSSNNVPSAAVIKKGETDVTACYDITYTNGTLEVTKKPLTITANSDSKEYDGTELANDGYTNTDLATGDVITSITITGSQTDRGSSPNVPSAAIIKNNNGNGNDVTDCYEITYVNGTLWVTGRLITITAGSGTKVYDGTPLTNDNYMYDDTKLYSGDAITSVTITGSQTIAGSSGNVPSAAVIMNGETDKTANYDFTYVPGTLTVTPKALTITASSDSKVYDGTALIKDTYTNTALATGDNIESVTMTGSQTDVGTSDNVPSGAVIKNGSNENVTSSYIITYTNGTLEVTAKAVTITANNASRPYDGTALTEAGFTTTDLETSDTHTFTVAMTAGSSITNVGTHPNVIATVDGVAVTTGVGTSVGNYLVTTANGTLTISGKPIGNGALATGFTIEVGEDNAITVKDGETTLTINTDYTIDANTTISASGRYSMRTIRGTGNYGGIAYIRNAIVNFQTDANQGEWSATFVAENADPNAAADNAKGHALPTDGSIKAYIITSIDGNWAIPEELNYIPEGVPVLLLSTKASNGFLVKDASGHTAITTTGEGNQVDKNMLEVRNDIWEDVPARTIYLLYKNEFVYNMAGDLTAGKVYLNPEHTVPASSPAPSRLWILWDTVTQINGITEDENYRTENDVWYTLDGQRLSKRPTRKGFYIKNGKKVIVK